MEIFVTFVGVGSNSRKDVEGELLVLSLDGVAGVSGRDGKYSWGCTKWINPTRRKPTFSIGWIGRFTPGSLEKRPKVEFCNLPLSRSSMQEIVASFLIISS